MLKYLKLSSLTYNCVFYRPEHNAKSGNTMKLNIVGLEMQKRNISTDIAQQVDEKNVVICLVIMFAAIVMTTNMSKMVHFPNITLMATKN